MFARNVRQLLTNGKKATASPVSHPSICGRVPSWHGAFRSALRSCETRSERGKPGDFSE
jgi:hypothetical protein